MSNADQQQQQTETFEDELKLLSRLLYMNKNQHRRGKYFQALDMANRWLRKASKFLTTAETQETPLKQRLESATTVKDLSGMFETIKSFLETLIQAACAADASRTKCVFAAERVSSLVAQGRFIPFAVVALATMSRLESHAQAKLIQSLQTFDKIGKLFMRRCRLVFQKDPKRGILALEAVNIIHAVNAKLTKSARDRYLAHLNNISTSAMGSADDDVGDAVERIDNEETLLPLRTLKANVTSKSSKKTPSDKKRPFIVGESKPSSSSKKAKRG